MLSWLLLPAAVSQDLYVWSRLKKPLLVASGSKLTPARPGESGKRLCVTAAKHAVRTESVCCKQQRHAVEKRADVCNWLVSLYFVKSLDHGFIPEIGLGEQV